MVETTQVSIQREMGKQNVLYAYKWFWKHFHGNKREFPNKQCFDTSEVSYILTQFWYFLPGDRIRFHRSGVQSYKTAPGFRCQSKVHSYLCLWPTDYKSEVPMIPSLGLVHLLEWFTGLRIPFNVPDYGFVIKGYNPGTTRQKRCRARYGGRALSCYAISRRTNLWQSHQPESSPNCPFESLRGLIK